MHLQDQVRLHKELSKKIEELESQKKNLALAIMQQMTSKTMAMPGFIVRRCNRLSIKVSLEEARALDAIQLEETINKDRIKALYNAGHPISGISEIQYIQISSTSLGENE